MRSLLSNPSAKKARKFPQFVKSSFGYDINEVGNKFFLGFLGLIVSCALLLPATALGQVRTVHAEWTYTSTSGLAGFRLYKDGTQACQTTNTSSRAIDCSVDITTTPVSFTMTAIDSSGKESAQSSAFVVGNQAPIARVSVNTQSGYVPLPVSFDGSASSDADGSISSYSWNFGDGQTSTGAMTVHTFRTAGTYTVRLTVRDNYGATGTATKTVTVIANQAPTASISTNVVSGIAPLAVSFDGGASQDTDGSIATYAWIFGDGGVASGRTASHTFTTAGTYSVTLRVTDDRGATGQTTKTITVSAPAAGGSSGGTTANIAPLVTSFAAYQANDPTTPTRMIVSAGKGVVDLEAYAVDLNADNTLTFNWTGTEDVLLLNGTITDAVGPNGEDASIFTFDPAGIVPGIYKVAVEVTDNGSPAYSTSAELVVEVVDSAPNLGASDSDGDGISDAAEGYTDGDNDGIPDYLDAISDPTKLQTVAGVADRWLLMTEAGLGLRLGSVAFGSGNYIAGVTESDIALNDGGSASAAVANTSSMPSHIFDFQVTGLPQPGYSAKVVLPQRDAIPANAVYRKYFPTVGWTDYIINAQNGVSSAPGTPGNCPPPGDSAYKSGLNAGDYCVQLTIQDGGPNDSDNEMNGVIDDPSGVAVANSLSVSSPSNVAAAAGGGGGGGGCTINQDANDPTLAVLLVLAVAYLFRRKERHGE